MIPGRRTLAAAAAALVLAAACSGQQPSPGGRAAAQTAPGRASPSAAAGASQAPVLTPSTPSLRPLEVGSRGLPAPPDRALAGGPAPTRISIPAIEVDAPLVRLDLDGNGGIEVPSDFNRPGWYGRGPTPGAQGAAVILGHLDSHTGPAVFWRLSELKAGDAVLVAREDGSQVRFSVDRTESYSVDAFPSFEVYGATARPELRLITCGGSYSRTRGQYLANTVAFASLSS